MSVSRSQRRTVKNPSDRRYQRNEHAIQRVLNHALRERSLNLRAQDVCRQAHISVPTFYAHCKNTNDALKHYETGLMRSFMALLPTISRHHREVIFVILLHFIHRHRVYFTSTLVHHNHWLLSQLLAKLRPFLVHPQINDKCYDIYTGSLTTLIFCWGKHEGFADAKIPLYAKKLLQVRVMDLGI